MQLRGLPSLGFVLERSMLAVHEFSGHRYSYAVVPGQQVFAGGSKYLAYGYMLRAVGFAFATAYALGR